ncbi:MAG: hypothetical protein JOY67_06570 [Hyphomicrobiales bacterium]|nr:hypothetical protein [Hyphomicrobiales bacterium]
MRTLRNILPSERERCAAPSADIEPAHQNLAMQNTNFLSAKYREWRRCTAGSFRCATCIACIACRKKFSGRGIEGGRAVRELMRYSVKPTPSGMGNHASAFFLTRVTTDAKGISRCVMDIWGCPGQRPCNRMKVA